MKTPIQPGIPGLPPPDRRGELLAIVEYHRREASSAKTDMKNAALELAELAAGSLARMLNAPPSVRKLAEDFVAARQRFLDETEEAGHAVDALREEESRIASEGGAQ